MADPKDNSQNRSVEEVAFRLLYLVSWGENIDIEAWGKTDREWILNTYAECLRTVRDPDSRPAMPKPSAAVQKS